MPNEIGEKERDLLVEIVLYFRDGVAQADEEGDTAFSVEQQTWVDALKKIGTSLMGMDEDSFDDED